MTIHITEININYSWLNKHIDEKTKYLIMSKETLSLMQKDSNIIVREIKSDGFIIPRYRGCPIATCEELEFGTVDII